VGLGLSVVLARELGLCSGGGIAQARGLQMRREGTLQVGCHGVDGGRRDDGIEGEVGIEVVDGSWS
jgi:hypothetical protein